MQKHCRGFCFNGKNLNLVYEQHSKRAEQVKQKIYIYGIIIDNSYVKIGKGHGFYHSKPAVLEVFPEKSSFRGNN